MPARRHWCDQSLSPRIGRKDLSKDSHHLHEAGNEGIYHISNIIYQHLLLQFLRAHKQNDFISCMFCMCSSFRVLAGGQSPRIFHCNTSLNVNIHDSCVKPHFLDMYSVNARHQYRFTIDCSTCGKPPTSCDKNVWNSVEPRWLRTPPVGAAGMTRQGGKVCVS